MRTIHTVIRNRRSLNQSLSLLVLLIAVALVSINSWPTLSAARSKAAKSAVVPQTMTVPMLPGTNQLIKSTGGDQTDPHVDCNLTSYTEDDFQGSSTIHYFDFNTNTEHVVPGNSVDLLSDVSGSKIAFTEVDFTGDHIMVYDTVSQSTTVVPGWGRSRPSIGENLIAFEDRSFGDTTEISVYDLATGMVSRLTNDSLLDRMPAVSPTGNVVVWEKCQTNDTGCDIYSATQTSPGAFQTQLLTGAGEDRWPRTNGDLVVYVSDKGGDNDIYFQPVGGGTETHLSLPGDQRSPNISGDLISFESGTPGDYDIFVYDLSTGSLYQATNTPGIAETLSDISVCNGIGRIVYSIPGDGNFDVYAFTFQVPSSTPNQINDLIALVDSFNLPDGTENSLITKLQDALAAIDVSDTAMACDSLSAFINACEAQSGKKLTPDQCTQLITSANHIKSELGCP
jgi:hypothetical protein